MEHDDKWTPPNLDEFAEHLRFRLGSTGGDVHAKYCAAYATALLAMEVRKVYRALREQQ